MSKSTKEILSEIVGVIGENLKIKGFLPKKQGEFELFNIDGSIYLYEILLSKKKGYFSLSLRLVLKNITLMQKVNGILEHVLNDESYVYPARWDDKTIRDSRRTRLSNNTVAMLTDWRVFKGEESLEDFNKDFSIWMCVFDELSEIRNWNLQLLKSIDYAVDWFSSAGSNEWVMKNTQYPALYLLKKYGDINGLKEKYADMLSKSRDKKETELYLKYLNNDASFCVFDPVESLKP